MKGLFCKLNELATSTEKELTSAYAIQPMRVIGECAMMVRGDRRKVYLIYSNKHFAAIQRILKDSFQSYSEVESISEFGDEGVNVIAAFADSVDLINDNSSGSSHLVKLD